LHGGIFAFLADDPEWLGSILTHRPRIVGDPAGGGGRWNVVYYQDGDMLLKTHPGAATSAEVERFLDFLRWTSTRVMLGNYEPGPGESGAAHPTTCRAMSWAYTQLGETEGFTRMRERIRKSLPGFLARTMDGPGEAEHLFHLVMAFLYDEGRLHDPDLTAADLAGALKNAMMMLEQVYPENGLEPPGMPLVVTNGVCLAGWTGGLSLPTTIFFKPPELLSRMHRGVGGRRESGEVPLYPRNGTRAVLVATFLERSYPDTISGRLPPRTLFGVTHDCQIETY
jgi:hypothetical protein